MIRLLGIAESDCERIRDGLIAQPVNTLSSLGYVTVGAWILWRVARREVPRRGVGVAFGLAMIVVGLGSVAFHGPGAAGRFVHDYSIAVLLLVFVAADLISLHRTWILAAAAGVVTAAVLITFPDASNAVTAALIVAALALEVLVYRQARIPLTRNDRIAYSAAAGALAIAGTAQLLGRTDAPLCEPDSIWQAHALWHLLTALALGAFSIPLLKRTT